jgi:hypothetical protein
VKLDSNAIGMDRNCEEIGLVLGLLLGWTRVSPAISFLCHLSKLALIGEGVFDRLDAI